MPVAELVDVRFRAMASEGLVSAVVPGGDPAPVADAAARARLLEAAWSRFLPDSEVSELNRAAGTPVRVSPETALLVSTAVSLAAETGGLYDPTVLPAVRAVGYTDGGAAPAVPPGPAPGCRGIVVEGTDVTLPAGVTFDPGGVGKGLAADLLAARTAASGATAVVASLGGDLRVLGGSRAVEVEDPYDRSRVLGTLHVADGGVATSSVLARRFAAGHDIIDPRTGRPAVSDVVAVTVVAAGAALAEALATAVIVAGVEAGLALLDGLGAAGLVVDAGGRLRLGSLLGAFL